MKKRGKKSVLPSFLLFFGIFFLTISGFSFLDKGLSRISTEISALQAQNAVVSIMDQSLQETLAESGLSAGNFLMEDTNGAIAADAIRINSFCADLSQRLTIAFGQLEQERIPVPLGALTGTEFFANSGPCLTFTLQPAGMAQVDYETALEESGINQMHFQIWLKISAQIRVVNPLHSETFPMERKIMLADLVFAGDVPSHYFQLQSDG
ncbi:sporulation protein YunB [Anaerotignum lactatifermentans]|uniref:Sporulation protein YunB n=1 Tax=Anaerotignum lactatifermentans TaxID=160404 RepID=A0ABS2G891_9FIRM|nr:sporulation protein YunB [Anaerotignum lactatifermentans]MBM6828030.1 sporulation protein YunB [Anaerotignum lactatifermentans]MBM6876807.1 sporulation protein YunB [Anaerotignum lactatifermentans]MBM6949613.1 sporulation protein YunB [Anaerotignum lactatifermentans]